MKKLIVTLCVLIFIVVLLVVGYFGHFHFIEYIKPAAAAETAVTVSDSSPVVLSEYATAASSDGYYLTIPFDKYGEQSMWLQGKKIFENTVNEGDKLNWDSYTQVTCDIEIVFFKNTTDEITLQAPVTISAKYWWNSKNGIHFSFPSTAVEFEISSAEKWELINERKPDSFYIFLVDTSKHLVVTEVQDDSTDPGFYVGSMYTFWPFSEDFSAKKFTGYTLSEAPVSSNPVAADARITNAPMSEIVPTAISVCERIDGLLNLKEGTSYNVLRILLTVIYVVVGLLAVAGFAKLVRLVAGACRTIVGPRKA